MTCPGCDRDHPTLIGGYCGHCSGRISGAVDDALEDVDGVGDVVDVFKHKDGHVHVRLVDRSEPVADGGVPSDHDVYDVVVPVQREIIHRVEIADDPDMGATQAKVRAKEEIVLDEDELLNGTGRALDAPGGYDVVIKVGRELSATLTAAHPQEARRLAKRTVDMLPGEVVIGKPRVTRAPGDRGVE